MKQLPKSLAEKINHREQTNALRKLSSPSELIDFSSNDYLGFAKNETIFEETHQLLLFRNIKSNGATGSRLLSGNHKLYHEAENYIANFHQSEAALIFNSGYDANLGFFSSVPQRNDIILYDEAIHASIRDGIQLSFSKSYKFKHNDLTDLESVVIKHQPATRNPQPATIFIATESIFSMDGTSPNLPKMVELSGKHNAYLVVDEAHALGVIGQNGEGLVQKLQLQDKVFARIMTFGKALGCHGAAILGSDELKKYLINFSRSFIYTTGLSPHSVATILVSYQHLSKSQIQREQLLKNSTLFDELHTSLSSNHSSPIKSILFSGNERVKNIAHQLQQKGFDVKPILSPTVPEGHERLRFCLHSYNSNEEIITVLNLLSTFTF